MAFNFFGTKSPEPTSTPAAQPANTPPATPAQPNQMPGTTQEPVNPLDAYAKMYEKANAQPDAPPAFNLDPKVLGEVSGSLDFTKNVPQEVMQKALTGDAASLTQMMNHVAQQAYQAALSHGASLTDKFVGARSAYDLKSIGGGVKKELTSQALSSIPNYSHPVVREQLNRIAEQMAATNPELSPEEIAKSAAKYMQDLASAISPQSNEQPKENKPVDWASYLSNDSRK